MALWERLRERAAELGLSGSEVARRADLDERRYGHYVRGIREPDVATFLRICDVLMTTPNDLLLEAKPAKLSGREKMLAQLTAAAQNLDDKDLAAFTAQIKAVSQLRKTKP